MRRSRITAVKTFGEVAEAPQHIRESRVFGQLS
jgi:hypothetical protein